MEILGKSAAELGELRDQVRERERLGKTIERRHVTCDPFFVYLQDEATYDQVFQQTYFKEYIFKLRAKMDTFNVRNFHFCNFPLLYNLPLSLTHSHTESVGRMSNV